MIKSIYHKFFKKNKSNKNKDNDKKFETEGKSKENKGKVNSSINNVEYNNNTAPENDNELSFNGHSQFIFENPDDEKTEAINSKNIISSKYYIFLIFQ